MTKRSQLLRGGARALTGLLVAGAAAAVVGLGAIDLPEVSRQPLAIDVDTTHDAARTIVCTGSFFELGADQKNADALTPTGAPSMSVAGATVEGVKLKRSQKGDGLAQSFTAPLADPIGGAQIQTVNTDALSGTVASACAEPLTDQWVLGGESSLGVSTTLTLANPGAVSSTVRLALYDKNGEVEAVERTGVIVPAGTSQTVSLNGYAPDRARFAVHVVSTGAPVAAALDVGHVVGLDPYAVSSVMRQATPATKLVIPGITNISDHKQGGNDAGEGDHAPVLVRLLAPGSEGGTATVSAIDDRGRSTKLGELELVRDAVAELNVNTWPKGANAVVVEADVPVVASAHAQATVNEHHDYEWFVPAPELAAGYAVPLPGVSGGRLVLANTGTEDARITIDPVKGKSQTVHVSAGATATVRLPGTGTLTTTVPVAASVRYVSEGGIAGYPILAPDKQAGELRVYTR